jgi:hypothetical protein
MSGMAPNCTLRLIHERSGQITAVTGCEVLVDGEVVAMLQASGYALNCDLNDSRYPKLTITFPAVAKVGEIETWTGSTS